MEKGFYIAMKALLFHENRFLIVRKVHRETGKPLFWELPGGGMEYGETPEATLQREIAEEAGLEVEPVRPLSACNLWVGTDFQLVAVIYLALAKSPQVQLSEEHDDYRWITREEARDYDIHAAFRGEFDRWAWDEIYTQIQGAIDRLD